MKTSIIAVASLAGLVSFVSGFSVTNCNSGAHHNYGKKKCKNFNTGSRVKYDSNQGCQLQVYPGSGCEGDAKVFTTQDTCQDVGFIGLSVKATHC